MEINKVNYKLSYSKDGKVFGDSVELDATPDKGDSDSALECIGNLRKMAENALDAIHRDRIRAEEKTAKEGQKTTPKEAPLPEGFINVPIREDGYSPVLKRWVYHKGKKEDEPNFNINAEKKSGGDYQRSLVYQVYLNADGTTRPMVRK